VLEFVTLTLSAHVFSGVVCKGGLLFFFMVDREGQQSTVEVELT
jgi:hypothetical protein